MLKFTRNLSFLLFLGVVAIMTSCLNKDTTPEVQYSPENEVALLEDYFAQLASEGHDSIPQVGRGIYVLEFNEGAGDTVLEGDDVGVVYTGFFISGGIFDSSVGRGDGIYRFVQGEINHVPGFDDAIAQLNLGASGVFLLPSSLAYGAYGSNSGIIPPYTPILFELELKELNGEVAPE